MDDLSFYDVENAAVVTTLDLGGVAPASSADSMLWVSNTSTQYQAEDVTVAAAGTDGNQLWLSLDGDHFTASIAIGDIPPNGNSGTFWLRRVTPNASPTGNHAASLTATPTGWTDPIDTTTSGNVPLT